MRLGSGQAGKVGQKDCDFGLKDNLALPRERRVGRKRSKSKGSVQK